MIERTLTKRIDSLSEDFKILLVTGARQVGKTTILKSLLTPGRKYITLDNKIARELAQSDPEAFFIMNPLPCMIDEVQRVPELFIKMKELADESDEKNLLWLTGSQKPRLMRHLDDTLSGRVVEIDMYPLSQAEKQKDVYRKSFYPEYGESASAIWDYSETIENIIIGGYPGILGIKEENRADWFRSYISTYILGDIRDEDEDIEEALFRRLLHVLAARTAEAVNYTAIASEAGISVYNTKKLMNLLESYGIIYMLSPYSGNVFKTITKTPRMHFTDSGLCCHILGIESVQGFLSHPLAGRIFESYAISEIIRNARNNGDYAQFYFLREETKNKNSYGEIDLIKEKSGILYPMEIKLNASPSASMGRWFDMIPENKRGMGTVICMHKEKTLLSKSILAMPVSLI